MSDVWGVLTRIGQLDWSVTLFYQMDTWHCRIARRIGLDISWSDQVVAVHPTNTEEAARMAIQLFYQKHPEVAL